MHFHVSLFRSFQIVLATLEFFFICIYFHDACGFYFVKKREFDQSIWLKNALGAAKRSMMRRFLVIGAFSLAQKPRSIKLAKYCIENTISLKTKHDFLIVKKETS